MQSHYPAQFDREMGCTETEWLGWLPEAMGNVAWQQTPNSAHAQLGTGSLDIFWQTGEPRRIALISMPRLLVKFRFEGLNDDQRYTFMKRFDLYMQRGGG
ncbi:hypothetical protein [Variovorax sp. PCZ-1]|uniref:hypothetical protein n=1 Tax=Variovorax sp. PCZ-1 TaxID=2835533 RepID=UPI001BCECEB3|nr:hypothetical protein [Variovorax sp. PCZ-1]MBS7807313.1 hypothetical protein [Variovorax sp. PCZ-1]